MRRLGARLRNRERVEGGLKAGEVSLEGGSDIEGLSLGVLAYYTGMMILEYSSANLKDDESP
jgi:hypothetical protein